jgi:hypothetical protein
MIQRVPKLLKIQEMIEAKIPIFRLRGLGCLRLFPKNEFDLADNRKVFQIAGYTNG